MLIVGLRLMLLGQVCAHQEQDQALRLNSVEHGTFIFAVLCHDPVLSHPVLDRFIVQSGDKNADSQDPV